MQPSIGRIVHYKLSTQDVDRIDHGTPTGAMKAGSPFSRNSVRSGDVLPAVVVAVHNTTEGALCNLQVFLDGDCSYWATSRQEGDSAGRWSWPPRV